MGSFWAYVLDPVSLAVANITGLVGRGSFGQMGSDIYNISAFHPNKYRIYIGYLVYLKGTENSLTSSDTIRYQFTL